MRCPSLEYSEWEFHYRRILQEFNFDPEMDTASCELLSRKIGKVTDLEILNPFRKRNACVIGNSPDLYLNPREIEGCVKIVAGSAIVRYYSKIGVPDIIVTDLDNDFGLTEKCLGEGAVAIVHAHGDNMDLVRELKLQDSDKVIGTCQCRPAKYTVNFGGFTDGDRAVFLADYLESPRIYLVGFNYSYVEESTMERSETKARKLKFAKDLIDMLEAGRENKFGPRNIIRL